MKVGKVTQYRFNKSPLKSPPKTKYKFNLEDLTNYQINHTPFSFSPSFKNYETQNRSPMKQQSIKSNIARNISERIENYKSRRSKKMCQEKFHKFKTEISELETGNYTSTPQISENSNKIFKETLKKRNLSPHVLQRFTQYEKNRSVRSVKVKK